MVYKYIAITIYRHNDITCIGDKKMEKEFIIKIKTKGYTEDLNSELVAEALDNGLNFIQRITVKPIEWED